MGRAAFLVGIAGVGIACSAETASDEVPTEESNEALSAGSCDRASFAKCVNNKGGGACAKFCSGACRTEVEACARSGGGQGCVNKCTGSGSTCQPREEWTVVNTWECGFPYGWGGQNAAFPGKSKGTCTRQCDGTMNNCFTWKERNGRAQCTSGVPLDANQNPW